VEHIEKSLIGCMLTDTSIIGEVINNIKPEHFANAEYRKVYDVINSLYRQNKNIDIIAVSQFYNDYSLLTDTCMIVGTSQEYINCIKLLKENVARKNIWKATKEIQKRLKDNDYSDIENFKNECINIFNFDSGFKNSIDKPVINYLQDFIKEIKINKSKPVISTGFSNFNEKLGNGIYPGLYVIGAISSLGKTAMVLQMADNMASNGHDVLYLSLEMPKIELVSRSISRNMFLLDREKCRNVGTLTIMNGNFVNYVEEMDQAMKNYEVSAKNLIIQKCSFNTTIEQLQMKVRSYINKTSKKPIVIVDYLQVIKADGKTDKQMTDNIVYGLKDISESFGIPVIAVSSFNRASYLTKVSFDCFKESGAIEYTADVVVGLQLSVLNNGEASDKNKSEIIDLISKAKSEIPRKITAVVLKNRNSYSHAAQNFLFYPVNNYIQEV